MPQDPNFNPNYNLQIAGTDTPVINSATTQTPDPLKIVQTPPINNYQATAASSLDSLLAGYNTPTAQETQATDIQSRILSSLEKLGGQSTRKTELENQAGLGTQRTDLQNVVNQLQGLQKEAQAIPLQIQQDAVGRGVTAAGIAPIQTAKLRENSIKSLGLAAIGQTLQGNISLAESSIENALNAEFEPERQKLSTLKQLYTFNKDALERSDKKKADALNIVLSERTRLLGIEEANKKEIYSIGQTASKYGANPALVQKIFSAKSREEAIVLAGNSLTDPKSKYELEAARLDNVLKRAQIDRTQKETRLWGEPTPAERKAEKEALATAETAIPLLQDKVDFIGTLKTHPGLNSRVGTGLYTRIAGNYAASLLKTVTTLGIGSAGDASDNLSGAGQAFAGGVHQLVNKETIDTLINLKARGGTLGALSDQERILLQTAATTIGDWEIKDKNNNGTGVWNIDEANFKKELDTIKSLSERALAKARGTIYTPEEQAILNQAFTSDGALDPSGYFN